MRFWLVVIVVVTLAFGMAGCARQEPTRPSAEVAFDEMWDRLKQIEAPEDRVPILEAFMAEYPDTSESVNALGDVVYYRTEKLNDLPGAVATTRQTLDRTVDPEIRFEVGLRLHRLTHRQGQATDLGAVADELAAHREFGFVNHLNVVKAAEESGEWEVMFKHATAMEPFANEAAFRAAYPDDDFSDEQVKFSVDRRKAWVQAYQGGALTNLGRLDEAQEVFQRATKVPATTDFLGIPETPIDIYRGQAALRLGRPNEAMELFSHNAVMAGDTTAVDGLRQAYVAINGSGDGFDEHVLSIRNQIARPLPDVIFTDYRGTSRSLGTGDVMVISFWNPG